MSAPSFLRHLLRSALACSLLVPVVGCQLGGDDSQSAKDSGIEWPDMPAPRPTRGPIEVDKVAMTSGCPLPVRNPAAPTGDSLVATTSNFHAAGYANNVALSAETLRKIPDALSTTTFLDMETAYRAGAFGLDGGVAVINLSNFDSEVLDIIDIRPANLVSECMPLAAMIKYYSEGGDPREMSFDMDAGSPIPRDAETGKPYFEEHPPLQVKPLVDVPLTLFFDTVAGAYSFDIAITYEVRGERLTAVLDNQGTPFRIATGLCPYEEDRLGLSKEAKERMQSLRFQNVRERKDGFAISAPSPDEAAAECSW